MRIATTLCWLLLAVRLGPAAVGEEHDPVALLQSAVQPIVDAQQFTADFEFAVRVGLSGFEHGRFARYKLAFARPHRLLFLRTDGDMGSTLVSDGSTLTAYAHELNQYTQQPPPESLDEFSQSLTGMMLVANGTGGFLMALLADEPLQRLTAGMTGSEYVGRDTIDGQACHHLRFVSEDGDFDLWITAGDTPTLRRIRPDLSKQLGEEEQKLGFSIVISLELENWNFAPELDDATFAFNPPRTAELVEQFAARQPPAVAPRVVEPHPLIGQPAPQFALVALDGQKAFELDEVLGKRVVVLDFWATWCPPCVEGLPQLAALAQDFANRDVAFYAVNLGEDAATVRKFLTEAEIELPVLLDPQETVAEKYQVRGIPQTVLIGLDGRVHVVHAGLPEDLKGKLTKQLEALLAREDLAAQQWEASEESK